MKKGLNGLIMVKNQLSQSAKLKLYHALISSHLNYCSLIWISNITKKQLNMIKIIQKKAIRIVFSAKYNAHTNTLFERSNVTKAAVEVANANGHFRANVEQFVIQIPT